MAREEDEKIYADKFNTNKLILPVLSNNLNYKDNLLKLRTQIVENFDDENSSISNYSLSKDLSYKEVVDFSWNIKGVIFSINYGIQHSIQFDKGKDGIISYNGSYETLISNSKEIFDLRYTNNRDNYIRVGFSNNSINTKFSSTNELYPISNYISKEKIYNYYKNDIKKIYGDNIGIEPKRLSCIADPVRYFLDFGVSFRATNGLLVDDISDSIINISHNKAGDLAGTRSTESIGNIIIFEIFFEKSELEKKVEERKYRIGFFISLDVHGYGDSVARPNRRKIYSKDINISDTVSPAGVVTCSTEELEINILGIDFNYYKYNYNFSFDPLYEDVDPLYGDIISASYSENMDLELEFLKWEYDKTPQI